MSSDPPRQPNSLMPSTRSRMGQSLGVQILGVGSSVPTQTVRNEDLTSLGCDADWILQRTGIEERRHAPPGVATSDLAYEAAIRCIEAAGVDPEQIDLVLVGTYTPDMLLPATACLVQDRLELCAPAIDIQAACAGFMYAVWTGMQFISTGAARLVLAIGADCNSRVINPDDVRTYPLFGDGAGAALLAPGAPDQGFVSWSFGSDGSGADLLCRRMGGSRMPFVADDEYDGLQYLQMEGRSIFKWAVHIIHDTIAEVLEAAEMSIDQVDLVILHQANLRIINSAAKDLGISSEQLYNNVSRYGNTSAGSIPLALDEAIRNGRVKPGSHILLSGFGAGLTWGTTLLRW